MIVFSPIRTRRIDAKLQELTLGDEISLCHLPVQAHEKALSDFLARVLANGDTPTVRHIADPRGWSVGERLFVLAHYCTQVREDGPDYAVTDVSVLSDYLDYARDLTVDPVPFLAHEDNWIVTPLSGAAAEAIELLQGESGLAGREHWLLGAMAAQLLRTNETSPPPDAVTDFSSYATWLADRMTVLQAMPSSAFTLLYEHYSTAMLTQWQFFRVWFDEQGVIALPKEAGAAVPPARFRILSGIGGVALSLTGKA
jgi:hypothetical protein